MKRLHLFLTILAVIIGCFGAHAEKYNFQASAFCARTYNKYRHSWNDWSNWEPSTVYLSVDGDNNKITIYSETAQVYRIYRTDNPTTDRNGDSTMTLKVKDQDGNLGTIYWVKRANGSTEVYIYYSSVAWAYTIDYM